MFLLFACVSENDPGKIYALDILQSATLEQYAIGEDRSMEINEMATDKSREIDFHLKMIQHQKLFTELDSITGIHIALIEKMKLNMFHSFGEELSIFNKNTILSRDYNEFSFSQPAMYAFSNVKHTGGSAILTGENVKLISSMFKDYRKEVCMLLEASNFVDATAKPYFFKDPMITHFKDDADFYRQFEKAMKQSNIALDDIEMIKTIYKHLSKTDEQWADILTDKSSWIDAVSVLLSIENTLLTVRALAFDLLRSRGGGCGEFGFTQILPIVYGPNAAIAGDTVQLKIMMAAYNEYANPSFEIYGGGKLVKVEKGIGYFNVVVPKAREIGLRGNITLTNKSGVPRTQEWSHKIKVLSRK